MKKYIITSLVVFSFILVSKAQNVEFTRANISDKKQLKEAVKNINIADKILADVYPDYNKAMEHYQLAQSVNPNNAYVNYQIGYCIYNSKVNRVASLEYFNKAYKLKPDCEAEVLYYLGLGNQITYNFDKAIEYYRLYINSLSGARLAENSDKAYKRISECENGKILIQKEERVFIDNIGPEINSEYDDYGPVITADESILMFTSKRPIEGQNTKRGELFENIYLSNRKNKSWSKAVYTGKPLNTDYHDAIKGISNDGSRIIIYRGDNGGDLYISKASGDNWSRPDRLPKQINTNFHEASGSFSYDGKSVYFVSDKPGGQGGHDIYFSTMNERGRWSEPQNLGAVVNTPYEEISVFAHPDGKTLYFSSNGHNTMGGYDIFKTTYENGQWTEPVNLGHPINTPDDDVFFVIAASGRRAYYSSAKEGGVGGQDIYMITFLGPEKIFVNNNEDNLLANKTKPIREKFIAPEVEIVETSLTLLKGIVIDEKTREPIYAEIELYDNEKAELLATFQTNAKTGRYLVSLPSGKNYGIAIKADKYLFHSENFDLPDSAKYQEIEKEIALKKMEVGQKIVLRNIFFDFNKSSLRPESNVELENLLKLLNENTKMKIEISGHTDNVGSAQYNKKLSESRAKSVVDYLTSKGINKDRLSFAGYGFDEPIAPNDTEEGRQLNRRTEFKIVQN
ncbi:MAG: OmpA family protein [Bacteroidales bacterium]|jgi:outer membrane protein OmpA-like peptidoglycan-associated protein|nr:OmpA family protein [Bacteroidales bacterium]